jgi:hypothetical protein
VSSWTCAHTTKLFWIFYLTASHLPQPPDHRPVQARL